MRTQQIRRTKPFFRGAFLNPEESFPFVDLLSRIVFVVLILCFCVSFSLGALGLFGLVEEQHKSIVLNGLVLSIFGIGALLVWVEQYSRQKPQDSTDILRAFNRKREKEAQQQVVEQLTRWGIGGADVIAVRWAAELLKSSETRSSIGFPENIFSWMVEQINLGNLQQASSDPGDWHYQDWRAARNLREFEYLNGPQLCFGCRNRSDSPPSVLLCAINPSGPVDGVCRDFEAKVRD